MQYELLLTSKCQCEADINYNLLWFEIVIHDSGIYIDERLRISIEACP